MDGPHGLAHGARLKLLEGVMRGLLFLAVAAAALCVGADRASAAAPITDQTTCLEIIGYSFLEDDIPELNREIGKYAADVSAHTGVPVPKNLQDFGMSVGQECRIVPLVTLVSVVANKVRGYWHD
jgi:hypothetical protein